MVAMIGLQLCQTLFDLLAQSLALGQTLRQAVAGCFRWRIFFHDFQFDVIQGGIELGKEFFHVFLAPAFGPAASGLDFGAIQSLQSKTDRAGVHRQLHGLFKNGTQSLFVIPPETPQAVVVGAMRPVTHSNGRCSAQAASNLRVERMRWKYP